MWPMSASLLLWASPYGNYFCQVRFLQAKSYRSKHCKENLVLSFNFSLNSNCFYLQFEALLSSLRVNKFLLNLVILGSIFEVPLSLTKMLFFPAINNVSFILLWETFWDHCRFTFSFKNACREILGLFAQGLLMMTSHKLWYIVPCPPSLPQDTTPSWSKDSMFSSQKALSGCLSWTRVLCSVWTLLSPPCLQFHPFHHVHSQCM